MSRDIRDINHTEIRGALYRVTLVIQFTETISVLPNRVLPIKVIRGAYVMAGNEMEAIKVARDKITEDIWMGHPDRFSGKIPTPQAMEVTAEAEELAGYSNLLISSPVLTETWREFEDETVGLSTPVGVKTPSDPGPDKGPGRAN